MMDMKVMASEMFESSSLIQIPANRELYKSLCESYIEGSYRSGSPMIVRFNQVDGAPNTSYFSMPKMENIDQEIIGGIERIFFKDETKVLNFSFKEGNGGIYVPIEVSTDIKRPLSSKIIMYSGGATKKYLNNSFMDALTQYTK